MYHRQDHQDAPSRGVQHLNLGLTRTSFHPPKLEMRGRKEDEKERKEMNEMKR